MKGDVVVTTSSKRERLEDFLQTLDENFQLTNEDIQVDDDLRIHKSNDFDIHRANRYTYIVGDSHRQSFDDVFDANHLSIDTMNRWLYSQK